MDAVAVDPGIPPLEPEELEWYRWLINGLLAGAFAVAVAELPETSTVPAAIDAALEQLDELFARIIPDP